MTELHKPIKRVSNGFIYEAGKVRKVIVILRPPDVLGFRAQGCKKEYQLTTSGCYKMAVWAEVEKRRLEKKKVKKGDKK